MWALEAYGAAHILQELLTCKSDDVYGRAKILRGYREGRARHRARRARIIQRSGARAAVALLGRGVDERQQKTAAGSRSGGLSRGGSRIEFLQSGAPAGNGGASGSNDSV